jgi:hypothetical protein
MFYYSDLVNYDVLSFENLRACVRLCCLSVDAALDL